MRRHVRELGLGKIDATATALSGPGPVLDAILSGAADYGTAALPSLLTLWERTRGSANEVKAVGTVSNGAMTLYAVTQSSGQGHETIYPQIVAATLGIDTAAIRFHPSPPTTDLVGNGTKPGVEPDVFLGTSLILFFTLAGIGGVVPDTVAKLKLFTAGISQA